MPQLTLPDAVTCCLIKFPLSWQLTWQDPLALRNHCRDVKQASFHGTISNKYFYVFDFGVFLHTASCRTNRNMFFHSFHFTYSFRIYLETKNTPHVQYLKINLSNMLSSYPLRWSWSCVQCSLRISTILPSHRYSTLSSMNWKVHIHHAGKETSATNSPSLSAPIAVRARGLEQKGLHGPENDVEEEKFSMKQVPSYFELYR